ncbi:MAG: hypothetical protein QNJ60_01435 [Xenococcaceae cyanobacterium MO_188.B19]|nr:hypothetical protein [Xenococcaceae cyanobacterium MO_188.B19]
MRDASSWKYIQSQCLSFNTFLIDFRCLFILDDRQQVVDMWRSLGLTVFQVAEGDF